MIVVSDTSPINYLLLIDLIDLLPLLYQRVLIPYEVHAELLAEGAPEIVGDWARKLPPWCTVVRQPAPVVAGAAHLDPGERAAIQMALHLGVSRILVDDLEARQVCESLSLDVRGTLGVLQAAAKAGELDLHKTVERLMRTNFTASKSLIEKVLRNT